MTEQEILTNIIATLRTVAPEVDGERLDLRRALRAQVDLDSMDWLNVLVALHRRFGVDIPEADYGKLVTLKDIQAYLMSHMP